MSGILAEAESSIWKALESKMRDISCPGAYVDTKSAKGQREKIGSVTTYHHISLPESQQNVH